jgi:hypothetical protein
MRDGWKAGQLAERARVAGSRIAQAGISLNGAQPAND